MTAESGLKWLLRFISLTTVFALFSAVMPQSWLAHLIHRVDPDTPTSILVTYLARMLSAMYVFTGLLCWISSTDLKRYRPLIWVLGVGSLIVAPIGIVVLFWTVAPDHRTGIFWIVFGDLAEGLAQAVLLVILLLCTRATLLPGLPKASTPAHTSSSADGQGS